VCPGPRAHDAHAKQTAFAGPLLWDALVDAVRRGVLPELVARVVWLHAAGHPIPTLARDSGVSVAQAYRLRDLGDAHLRDQFAEASCQATHWSTDRSREKGPRRGDAAGNAEMVDQVCHRLWLAEREDVRLGAGLEERDLQGLLADRVELAHQLVQAAVPEKAVSVLVDVDPVRGAGSLAVEEHAEGDRASLSGREHEMRVARVEAEADAPPGLPEHDMLRPIVHSPARAQWLKRRRSGSS
jgi:hypothetical protein